MFIEACSRHLANAVSLKNKLIVHCCHYLKKASHVLEIELGGTPTVRERTPELTLS